MNIDTARRGFAEAAPHSRSSQLRLIYQQLNALLDPEEAVSFPILDHLGDLIGQVEQDETRGAL